nr:unnamed protein product [Brassica oleracea]
MKERGQSDPQKLGDFKALTSWPSNPWQFQGTNTIIVAAFTMATALLLLSLCGGVSAATPVLTVHDYPSGMTKTEEGGFGWQVWHRNGTVCPHGTVPVQRVEAEAELSQGKYGPLIPDAAERATKGHQASFFFITYLPIYGTRATLNVWNPVVESGDDFSLAQIWVTSGNYKNNDLNTIETGWQVYPNKYGDRQARLFTYWTSDAYLSSGCYNHYGRGFVHVNRHVALGGAIAGTSTIGGDQFDITLQIWKVLDSIPATTDNPSSPSVTSFTFSLSSLDHMDDDYKQNFCGRGGDPKSFLLGSSNSLHDEPPIVDEISGLNYRAPILYSDPLSGHWWLGMGLNVVPIGYWPVELFTTLSDHASEVQWGGEVVNLNISGMSNTTQMGSGEFPGKGFRKAAYFCNLQIAEKNRSFLPPQDFHIGATQPDSYSVAKTHSRDCGDHFYYGGPGPLRSSSYQSDPLAFVFLFLAVYFVV